MEHLLNQYWLWLLVVSLLVLVAERIAPWRREQKLLRPQLLQDLFWLAWNGHFLALLLAPVFAVSQSQQASWFQALSGVAPDGVQLLTSLPLWAQVVVALLLLDFLEWCIHLMLHAVPFLWRFHRLHHSILVMDWIGNFRFHWVEVLVYQSLKFLPLTLLGASSSALLIAAVFATLVGHLNHSNLALSYGPLRYVFNSPKMHLWHHEAQVRNRFGVNFGVVFSLWDWLFGTAFMPLDRVPQRIGFAGDQNFPAALWWRLLVPFLDRTK